MNRSELSKVAQDQINTYNKLGKIDGRSYKKLLTSAKNGRTDTLKKIINNIDRVAYGGKISYASLLRKDNEIKDFVEKGKALYERSIIKQKQGQQLAEMVFKQRKTMEKVVEQQTQSKKVLGQRVKANYFEINKQGDSITTEANALITNLIGRHNVSRQGVKTNNYWFNNIKSIKDIKQALRGVFNTQQNRYKMVVKFGLLLFKYSDDGKGGRVVLFRPNEGRHEADLRLSSEPHIVKNWSDLERFIGLYINLEYLVAKLKKPDSRTKFLRIASMLVEVYPLGQVMSRAVDLPEHILKSKFVSSLKDIPYNLCVFASLAMAKGSGKRCIKEAKNIFEKLTNNKFYNTYDGYDITNLEPLASQEKMNINVYTWDKLKKMMYLHFYIVVCHGMDSLLFIYLPIKTTSVL